MPAERRPATIPLSVPRMAGREAAYLTECVETNFVSSVGPFVERFEAAVAAFVEAPHAVATSSGTAALHLALQVAGVEAGDEVLVSTLSFIAPANAVRYLGAWPVFVDAEADGWQMDVGRVADFLAEGCEWREGSLRNRATGRRVAAVLPVHVLGHPVDMDPLLAVAGRFELPVVEDATESLGARYRGRATGTLGTLGCFSFNGNKLVTTGGGGAVVTGDETLAARVRYLATQAKDDPVEYVHAEVGYNYRMTNIEAAVGCAQMEAVESYLEAKRRSAAAYGAALAALPGITLMPASAGCEPAWWLYTVLVGEERFGRSSRELRAALADRGIESRPLWQPLHRSPAHAGAPALGGEVADGLHARALSLPSSVGLTGEERERVVAALRELCAEAR